MPTRREFLHHALCSALALWSAPVTAWAAPGPVHVVRKGDTLTDIARAHGTSVDELKRLNRLRSGLIKVGQTLVLPASAAPAAITSATYVVRKGDTLGGIADAHGVGIAALKRANGLVSDLIRPGQTLVVPAAAAGPGDSSLLAPVIAATGRLRVDASRWRYIVCHHSAIEAGNAKSYGAEHTRRGMEHGLAYHFVIGNGRNSGDGEIEIGPRWTRQLRGGHVRNSDVNDTGIGICVVGNLQNHPPTRRQQAALNELLGFLRNGHTHRSVKVTVHKWVDKNHTVCPGRHFDYVGLQRFA